MNNTNHQPTEAIARKVVDVVKCGLSHGLGKAKPGQMCIEAAVNYAFGLPHGDEPPCVGPVVRQFKIQLNDCAWSSSTARAAGMLKLGVAQLGSDTISQEVFGELVFIRGTQELLPFVFRAAAKDKHVRQEHKARLLEHADRCSNVKTLTRARDEVKAAYAPAYAYAYAYAYASAYAYDSAYDSAYDYASAPAYAYAYAYAYASAYAWFMENLGDTLLQKTADVGLWALQELTSPGCQWLWLCD